MRIDWALPIKRLLDGGPRIQGGLPRAWAPVRPCRSAAAEDLVHQAVHPLEVAHDAAPVCEGRPILPFHTFDARAERHLQPVQVATRNECREDHVLAVYEEDLVRAERQ